MVFVSPATGVESEDAIGVKAEATENADTGVVVYADPVRELAVAFLNTGKPMLAPGMVRWYWILQRLAMLVPRRQLPWRSAR